MVVFPLSVSPLFLSLLLHPPSSPLLSPHLLPPLPSSPPSQFLLFHSSPLPLYHCHSVLLSSLSLLPSLLPSSTFLLPPLPLTSTFAHFLKWAHFPRIHTGFPLPCALALQLLFILSFHSYVCRIVKRTPLRTPPLTPLPFSPAQNRQPVPPPPPPVSYPPRVLPLRAILSHQTVSSL